MHKNVMKNMKDLIERSNYREQNKNKTVDLIFFVCVNYRTKHDHIALCIDFRNSLFVYVAGD